MESIKEFPRGITDQVISPLAKPVAGRRAPGPGLKLRHGGLTPEASGDKHQASSAKLLEKRATSIKRQDPGPWKKFYGTRTEGLNQDK